MDYSALIEKLYSGVLEKEISEHSVDSASIKEGLDDMAEAYKRYRYWRLRIEAKTVDYNNAVHRCAYLYKYAMLHTDMVTAVLQAFFKQDIMKEYVNSKESLNLCSLGGGPGTDIVALLIAIREAFGLKQCNAIVVDYSAGWQHTFGSVVSALRETTDSDVSRMVDESRFKHQYLEADLLEPSSFDGTEVEAAIREADIMTMVKFVSAAACYKTEQMLEKIFRTMKPGSMLLCIDNAGGRFHEAITSKAEECGLQAVFNPLEHLTYPASANFCSFLYGCTRQRNVKVTVEMWRQPLTKSESPNTLTGDESSPNFLGLPCSGSDDEDDEESADDESCSESVKENSVNEESLDESTDEKFADEACSQYTGKSFVNVESTEEESGDEAFSECTAKKPINEEDFKESRKSECTDSSSNDGKTKTLDEEESSENESGEDSNADDTTDE